MPEMITETDLGLIYNMALTKPVVTIARVMEISVEEIGAIVKEYCDKNNFTSYQERMQQRKALRPSKPKKVKKSKSAAIRKPKVETEAQRLAREKKEERAEKARINANIQEKQRSQRESKRGPLFKTKEVDLSKLISVRLDDKTLVFVKPGTDTTKIRIDYEKRQLLKKKGLSTKPR